jgi:rhodanese-related sulfurtransferase
MVLVFSEHVNRSQGVLNEINIAAGANVTIVPFRLASVEFNPELHYYLGRTHWLDAFPPPVDAYIDALVATIQRNLPQRSGDLAAPLPPPPPAPAPPAPPVIPAPPTPRPNHLPLVIAGGVFALVALVALAAGLGRQRSPAQEQATNAISAAVANAIAAGDKADQSPGDAPPAGPQPPHGDGSELTPVAQANPGAVGFYENELQPGGPPPALDGATVINTAQLLQSMRERDAGSNPFWLIDARGCTQEPTIPTAICLPSNSIQDLEAKAPDKAVRMVVFCHDGACPMSFSLASQAVAAGYANVFWYRGGVNAWTASGEPTVSLAGGGQ